MLAFIRPSSCTRRSLNDPPCAFSWFWCSPADPPTSFWLLLTPIGHHADRRPVLRRRHRVDRVLRHDLPLDDVLHVDDRAGAGDRDGLFERADPQVGVHRRGEGRRQLDAFALDGREPGQREGDRIGARPQVDDLVLALRVGGDRSHAFDQRRAARFDSDARHHRAGACLSRRRRSRSSARERWQAVHANDQRQEHNARPSCA